MSPTLQKRIEMAARELGLDPRADCQLAKLRKKGEITPAMEVAAHKVGEIYGRWERCIGRSRSAKGFSYELGFSGRELRTAEQEAARDEREKKARAAFEDLQDQRRHLRRDLRDAIETLCVEDRHVLPIWYQEFRVFFGKLVTKWKITSARTHGGA